MRVFDPRTRLRELAAARRVTLAGLSRMLDRPERYLSNFARRRRLAPLDAHDRRMLALFFGVSEMELGGDAPHWPERRSRRAA
ncbi:MAG: hypothetical protein BGN95_03910 [Sphingomonas sp. 66-10]|jgi:hypothetical protein|uniref:hypothetical protein n=1 Tax=Sphingomonas sp. 66-10 TaxID=1895848 RepID=UPI00092C9115|nr:hypothetical protein [Sphingomonas sp. 66-10]OJU22722.1 MAG: hypothetical protein BGN95_03910 [Sphingomonas sp. 66-10]